jgi:cytochrome c-type biogenesis protein CcmH
MLARSYKSLGRFEEAVQAYGKAEKVINDDPDLLASYAEADRHGQRQGPQGQAGRTGRTGPEDRPQARSQSVPGRRRRHGSRRCQEGHRLLGSLLPQVEPGSEIDQMLRQGIDKMKAGK